MLIVLIEVVGYTVRLITLGFRLSANILRGHLIIDCMITGAMVQVTLFIRIVCYIGRVLTLVFELCVIFIQAFVFSLLSCIYLAEAYVYSIIGLEYSYDSLYGSVFKVDIGFNIGMLS